MLNILSKKIRNNLHLNCYDDKYNNLTTSVSKHFSPLSREWFNSVYAYNKNVYGLLPTKDVIVKNLIQSYFNLYSRLREKKIIFTYLRNRARRRSLNKILTNVGQLKHTNDRLIINIFTYNRRDKFLINNIKKIAIIKLLKKSRFNLKIKLIKDHALKLISKIRDNKKLLLETLNWKDSNFKDYESKCYNNFVIKSLKREILFMCFKQLMYINKYKFNYDYIINLTTIIENIYKKKVDFNIVNLKYYYFNSYILSNIIATRLRKRKNRIYKVLLKCFRSMKVPVINESVVPKTDKPRDNEFYNTAVYKFNEVEKVKYDSIDCVLGEVFQVGINKLAASNIEGEVIKTTKYKSVSGVRVQASGRLTRRITAARSIVKIRYKGSLKNIDSTYRNLSSAMLRGNSKSNIEYSKLKSKIRIGSFGLKGWVSGY